MHLWKDVQGKALKHYPGATSEKQPRRHRGVIVPEQKVVTGVSKGVSGAKPSLGEGGQGREGAFCCGVLFVRAFFVFVSHYRSVL